jgi:hypothetical protein
MTQDEGMRAARGPMVGGVIVAVVVLLFTRGWHDGRTTLDGNGVVLYADIGVRYWRSLGHIPYFVPGMWDGTPIWALAPIFPVLYLLPLARLIGPEAAVRYSTVALQIIGGWGAMVLAASLWRDDSPRARSRMPAQASAVVAGCLYALNPIVISHGTLFGHETTIAVLAATPWLVWALRRGLRGDGTLWLILAGIISAFAILDQAEHAYALVIICALVTIAQAVRTAQPRAVLLRASGVLAVIVGTLAHWLVPLKALTSAFILSPPDVVSSSLTAGIGAQIGNEPGTFLHRGPGLASVVAYDHPDILRAGSFYLGWVWVIGAAVALVILAARPHRDRDATLSALLLAAVVCVWMSTAATPLARSGPGVRHQWLALAVVGVIGGLCAGVFIRRVSSGRVATGLAIGVVVVLFAAPYITLFLVLQHLIPLAGNLRLPRLYPLAVLGLSLAAAYPISLIGGSVSRRVLEVRIIQFGAVAAAVSLLGLAIADIWPYRTFYRVRSPSDSAAYAAAAKALPPGPIITEQFGDPRVVEALVDTGHALVTGWPHPIAERGLWGLAVTPQEASPDGYRNTAAALAGATSQVNENDIVPLIPVSIPDQAALAHLVSNPHYPAPDVPANGVEVDPIPSALPIVRTYDQAVVVTPSSNPSLDAATELAVGLVANHVSVVQGGAAAVKALGSLALGGAPQPVTCSSFGAENGGAILNEEVAVSCALHRWVGSYVGLGATELGRGVGAEFTASPGLAGVALWLVGPAAGVRVQLRPVESNGALGAPIGTAAPSPPDANGLIPFAFPAQPAGRYAFLASCPGCSSDQMPALVFTKANGPGNMVVPNHLVTDLVVDFAPVYPLPPPAPRSTAKTTTLRSSPGNWEIEVQANRPQLLVLAQSDFPGWRATVDGKPVPVLAADVAFVGVSVPAGTHRVVLRYHAPGVTLGDWITVLTLLICLGFVVRPLGRRIRGALPSATALPSGWTVR